MSYETDQLRNPAARRFHGYQGREPIYMSDRLHIDGFAADSRSGVRYFVAAGEPVTRAANVYVSRAELVAAARAILNHFEEQR